MHREIPGNFESTNLSRDNLSREIGRFMGHGAESESTFAFLSVARDRY